MYVKDFGQILNWLHPQSWHLACQQEKVDKKLIINSLSVTFRKKNLLPTYTLFKNQIIDDNNIEFYVYSCFLVNSADRIIRVYESGEVLACGKDGEPEPIQKLQDLVNR